MNFAAESLNAVVVETFARHAATALISSLWQGIGLAALVAVCFYLVPSATARLRFTVWTVVFAILAALPLLEVAFSEQVSSPAPFSTVPHLQLATRWSYVLAAIWFAAIVVRSAHLALQAIKLRALWHSAIPVSTKLLPELPLGRVQLCVSTELDRPSVIGFFSPRILVPAWLFDQLTAGELKQIVLHELEHLRRRDDWMNLFQKIGLVLFPLNPTLLWIDRRLASERELACDDGVLSRTNAPRAYATCLTSLAERRLQHRHHGRLTALALGAIGAVRHTEFSRRIESVLRFGRRSSLSPTIGRAFAALLIAGVFAGAATLARAPQLVSFTADPQTHAAATLTPVFQPVLTDRTPHARFENAAFHLKPTAGNLPAPRAAKPKLKLKPKPRQITPTAELDTIYQAPVEQPDRRLMIRTSLQQSIPQPMLVTLPDGRTFLATYASDPYQAGWLLIQL